MATKQVKLPEIGLVTFYKRRGSRSIRLSIARDGSLRVTLPPWVPYRAGLDFVRSKINWINAQQRSAQKPLINGQAIGKAHHLYLQEDSMAQKIKGHLRGSEAIVVLPLGLTPESTEVQKAARAICIRALRKESEQLLPKRLAELAKIHEFTFNKITIRQLKSRWGSCNQHHDITLNLFLIQLPWSLIDYVLLHELTHTKVLHHGPVFWKEFETHTPDARKLQREIRTYQPTLL